MTAPHPATTRRGEGVTADGEFYMPTRVFFGRGVAGQAGAHAAGLAARRVMLVTDPGVQAAGLADPVRDHLIEAALEVVDFQQVEPNPRDVDCLAGAGLAADIGVEGLVAVGGGSAIDSSKSSSSATPNLSANRRESNLPIICVRYGCLADCLPVLLLQYQPFFNDQCEGNLIFAAA